jgi:hypothetical protein
VIAIAESLDLTTRHFVGHNKYRQVSVVWYTKRRGAFVMTELVRMHSMRQLARNEQENIPVLLAQELLRIFVADACLGFSKAWNPHPSFFNG